jgi:hypothetical protein
VKRNQKGPTLLGVACVITECEPNRVFRFTVGRRGRDEQLALPARAERHGHTTSESFRLKDTLPLKVYWALLGWSSGPRQTAPACRPRWRA